MDAIDERNRKAKLAKMVIKRRNVIYTVPQEEKKEDTTDILARLEEEKKNKEAKKRMEIEQLVEEREIKQKKAADILNERSDQFEKSLQHVIGGEPTEEI